MELFLSSWRKGSDEDKNDITHLCVSVSSLVVVGTATQPVCGNWQQAFRSPSVSVLLWKSGATSMFSLQLTTHFTL
jgi:hypothetical protein